MGFESDFAWGRQFIPSVKGLLGPLLLGEANEERDQHEATDLIVLTARDMRIGVRIRRAKYLSYAGQFTVRCSRPSGTRTEWAKILLHGWGDWLFYGFDTGDLAVDPWCVVDLHRLRGLHVQRGARALFADGLCGKKPNADGSSEFIWFETRKIVWPGLLVAKSESWPVTFPEERAA